MGRAARPPRVGPPGPGRRAARETAWPAPARPPRV